MGLLAWGVALAVVGALLALSDLVGFRVGLPLAAFGIALLVLGLLFTAIHGILNAGRAAERRI